MRSVEEIRRAIDDNTTALGILRAELQEAYRVSLPPVGSIVDVSGALFIILGHNYDGALYANISMGIYTTVWEDTPSILATLDHMAVERIRKAVTP